MAAKPDQERFKRCPHCQGFVPELATVCMYCSRDIPRPKKSDNGNTAVAVVLAAIILFVGWRLNSDGILSEISGTPQPGLTATPTPDVRAEAITVVYEDLARNTESYVGKYVYFRGQVSQVAEGSGGRYVLRVAVSPGNYGSWDDHLYVHYQGDVRLLEDDVVDFWLRIDGRKTYEALLGNQITIPEATALLSELVK